MIRPFRLNLSYCKFNKTALFVLFVLTLPVTGTQAFQRKIISIKADNHARYMNRGDDAEILYQFKTSEYQPGEAPQEIELYKSQKPESFQLRELLIGRSTNGSFHINPKFSRYIKASSHERRMKVVISNMNHHKEGYYQLRISNNGAAFLNHTTDITKEGDACTDALHGPLTNAPVNQVPWPSRIKSLHLCPTEGVAYSRGTYCVKDNDTPTEFRFAFEYYDNTGRYHSAGFLLDEKSPKGWSHIMAIKMRGNAYQFKKDSVYTVEAYFINDGIAFTLDFKNSSECVSTDLTLTMRKIGTEDVEKHFTVKTDCLKNDCKTPTIALKNTDAPTTSDYSPEHTSATSQLTSPLGYRRQSVFETAALIAGLLTLQYLIP